MDIFDYAHNDTSEVEKPSVTAKFNRPRIGEELAKIRREAFEKRIPVCDDETLCLLTTLLRAIKPKRILELGTAVGAFAACAAEVCPNSEIVTIERDLNFADAAEKNFLRLGVSDKIRLLRGDAKDIIFTLDGTFDFIFMDCAKVQYVKFLPRLKELLISGGALVADDVLLYGYVTGERETPKKRKALVGHVREYIDAVTADGELCTTIINAGDGLAVSIKL